MSSLIFIFKVKRLSRRGKLCFVMHVFRAIKKHPVPRFAFVHAPTYRCQQIAINHGGWWEKHFSETFPVFESTRAAVLSMIIRSACALLLWCLFSRIVSLRVFSETSLGKRVNLVLSDFNHLLDWEAEVLRYGSFLRFRADVGVGVWRMPGKGGLPMG